MKTPFILFDFDGVIVDSFRPAFETNKMICSHVTEDAYRKLFEGNINDPQESTHDHTEACHPDMDFFAEYVPRMKKDARIVPGMDRVITELGKTYTLIIISSTISNPIREFLEEHRLAGHFVQIMGNDVHKSKVEKIKMVFEAYGVEPKKCIFITDTLGDMREAEKMNVRSVGATWGFHDPETLRRGNPFRLVEKPNELLEAVAEYFKKEK